MLDLFKVLTNVFLEVCLLIWVGWVIRQEGHVRAQRRHGVSLDLYRDFSDTLRGSKRDVSAGRPSGTYAMRSLTKDEVVHDIGYDDLQFRLLDGVERE